MKRITCVLSFILLTLISQAQEKEIRERIDKMFQSMYSGDTASLRLCFIPSPQLITYQYDSKGNPRVRAETINSFINGVASMEGAVVEEKLTGWQCLIDEGMASVWTPYEFYYNSVFHHCGVNSFQLVRIQGEWKISNITDTRRSENCVSANNAIMAIDSLINNWHHAAAIADEETFFGSMTPDGIYIGTDPTERWLRDELAEWSKKYFDRESAWDFKTMSRNIKLDPSGTLAWFDELLDTWMGTCRSTGIVVLKDKEWKIVHYHLSVALPNEKMDGYRILIGKE